jgi:FtsZ-binding cell division protein ZapB
MATINEDREPRANDDIPVSHLVLALSSALAYISRKKMLIIIISFTCGTAAFFYALLKKPTYTAICTFVLGDSGNSALGQYSSIASLAGINLGGGEGAFQGDNIFGLYKSRLMTEKTLLSTGTFNGKSQLLIDYYLDFNNMREKKTSNGRQTYDNFSGDPLRFNRAQDSIITYIWDLFNRKYLDVSKQDKKLSIYQVAFSSKDELFTQVFTEKLVKNVNDFYVQTKVEKASETVQVLQHEADSVKATLNSSFNNVASAEDANPNPNPARQSLRVSALTKQVDKQTASANYAEVIKNLEISKLALRQEVPLIQVIDQPVLPIANNRTGKLKAFAVGTVLGLVAAIVFLFVGQAYRSLSKLS